MSNVIQPIRMESPRAGLHMNQLALARGAYAQIVR
jgi:hypothetical protein